MRKKNKVLVGVMALYFSVMFLVCVFKPQTAYSKSERRELQQFPILTVMGILDGSFMKKVEDYALDQFPARDLMRNIKENVSLYVFSQQDNNNVYVENGYAAVMEYPFRKESIAHAVTRFRYIYDRYLSSNKNKIYYAVILDKNYFLAKESGHLYMDYEEAFSYMETEMDFMEYIDITSLLTIEDYYKTDTHWKQENIIDVAKELGNRMGVTLAGEYQVKELEQPFYGVYFGQTGLLTEPDHISYLTNDILESCVVYDFENGKHIDVYDMEKAGGRDPYEMYLSGSLSLLTIENSNANTDKELILFRDSYGSSLAPLLVEGYKKITIVDIRYISPENLDKFIKFENQDVLFLYSISVLNNSETIK